MSAKERWSPPALRSLFGDFVSDIRFGLRGLRKKPGFTLAAVLTLALGIGANAAIFQFFHTLLLAPLPFPDAERLVLVEAFKGSEKGRVSQREIQELQAEATIFEDLAAYYHSRYNVSGDGPPEAAACAINTHNLFDVLGAKILHGQTFAATDDFIRQYRVVLGHAFWKTRFGGDPKIVGKSITLDGGSYVVDGVLAPGAEFPAGARLFRQVTEYHGLEKRRHSVLARLKPGVHLSEAQEEMRKFSAKWQQDFPATNTGLEFKIVPLRDYYVASVRPYLFLLLGAVAFVLLIACVNVLNLLLSRIGERYQEMALRNALGAARGRLIRQVLTESLLLAALGGLVGLVLSIWWTRGLAAMVRLDLPGWMKIEVGGTTVLLTVGLSLVVGLASGLMPAFKLSRTDLAETVRAGGGRVSNRLRGGLVIGEVALALVLLLGAGLLIRSFSNLQNVRLGFEPEQLFTFRTDPPYWNYNKISQLVPFYEQAEERLAALPGVTAVAANQTLPFGGFDENVLRVVTLAGQSTTAQEENPFVQLQAINSTYFDVMGIPLRSGRTFESLDREGGKMVAVTSERLARQLWPDRDPIGQRLKLGPPDSENEWFEIVGVVGDVHSKSLIGTPSSDLYVSHLQFFAGDTFYALRTTRADATFIREIEEAIQAVDADQPIFNIRTMEERVADAEWQRRVASTLILAFALLALLLAAVGLYGVMA